MTSATIFLGQRYDDLRVRLPFDLKEVVRRLFRSCAGVLHPDHDGDAVAMRTLNTAYDAVRQA